MQRAVTPGGGLPGLPRIGVEHELCLWRDQARVDFRPLINQVAGGIRPLDPGDPRARRLPSGVALTADGQEAELATPPIPIGPGAPQQIDDLLRAERTELRERTSALGVTRLTGFSTHLNVSVPDESVVGLGLMFVESCLFALAAVVEPPASQGLLVRPRRGRLEVGGEYVEGPDLVAGLTLLAACVCGLLAGASPPPTGAPQVLPSREKYGWFVPPEELLENPEALDDVWEWARGWAQGQGLDPGPVDELVSGSRAVRGRATADPARCTFGTIPSTQVVPGTGPRELRNGLRAETEWLTWQHAVWLIQDAEGHQCRAVLPIEQEEAFLDQLDSGSLDSVLTRMLGRRTPRRRLVVHADIDESILWHEIRPGALVPAERLPDGTVPRVSKRQARRSHVQERRRETT